MSPLEGSKNRDSLLKKLVCVYVEGDGVWVDVHPCACGWVCTVSETSVCVCVCGGGGWHAFGYVKVGESVCVCA